MKQKIAQNRQISSFDNRQPTTPVYCKHNKISVNNTFVAGGEYNQIAISTDGVTWTAVTDHPFRIDIIAYGNGTFVAGGGRGEIAYSTNNGASWTAVDVQSRFLSDPDDYYWGGIAGIAYGNSKFVLVGHDHDFEDVLLTSPDGKTWTSVSCDYLLFDSNALVYGNNKFVAVGRNSWTWTSTNGTSWTSSFPKDTNNRYHIYAIAYGNGKFVVGGKGGKMSYFTDGSGGSGGSGSGSSSGTLTMTNILAKYNGKYAHCVVAKATSNNITDGAVGYQNLETRTLSRISNGKVSIPLWPPYTNTSNIIFSGNGNYSVVFYISNSEIDDDEDPLATAYFQSANSSGGNATISWNNATLIQ